MDMSKTIGNVKMLVLETYRIGYCAIRNAPPKSDLSLRSEPGLPTRLNALEP